MVIEVSALCFGAEYRSLDQHPVVDLGSGEQLATLGHVLPSKIAADCMRKGLLRRALDMLQAIPIAKRCEMSAEAADHFETATLDCGGVDQTPEDYTELLARTSGLSYLLGRQNSGRIADALRNARNIVSGLSLGLPDEVFDNGVGTHGGTTVCINPQIEALGCCMPNNSPGVHVIWAACLPFGIPPLVRPGSSEPFTPYRLMQAFIKAGFPKEVFGYYPCGYAAADRIPQLTKGAVVFGSDATVQKWAPYPLVNVHGSGYSKLILGEDRVDDWESLIPELALNISANSGRSCFAVSRIMVPRYGHEIAAALATELRKIAPQPLDHPDAKLSAMSMPAVAERVTASIDANLNKGGATDMSAPYRNGARLEVFEGRTYLHPTVVLCDSNSHPLANEEFLFPFAGVTECSNDQAFAEMGPTLSLGVMTNDEQLMRRARRSPARLVSSNTPTAKLDRTQPHEEDFFRLLYHRKSYVA